jgi:hypothetical protein
MNNLIEMLTEARDTADPMERARLLNEQVLPAVAAFRRTAIAERALSVKEACDFGNDGSGFTYSQIAREMGVSKPLVQQMVALARSIQEERMKSPK